MYFQRDYVLRMIEMLGELVRRICSIAREADARLELDEICKKASGMPMAMLRSEDPDALAELLGEAQRYLSAELLVIDLQISSRTQTEDQLLPLRVQTLALLCSLTEPDYAIPAAGQAKHLIENFLDQLPIETLLAVASLCERGGEYAAAEDALFAALPASQTARAQAEAFYARLEKLDDASLVAGNFSREEISEGRQSLHSSPG